MPTDDATLRQELKRLQQTDPGSDLGSWAELAGRYRALLTLALDRPQFPTVEQIALALHRTHGLSTIDPAQCIFGCRDYDHAAALHAALLKAAEANR